MVTGLMEVILYVQDMHGQVCFYRDTLELPVRYPAGLADYSNEYWVELGGGGCVLALHGGGQGRSGPDAPKLVFRVPDIAAARETLIARGLELADVRSPAPGVYVCDGFDPEGTALSIEQREME